MLRDHQFDSIWLPNLFRATAVCNFSFLISPDGSAPAALTSLVFDPPGPQIARKMFWFASGWLAYLFADVHLLPSDAFCSLIFLCLLFSFLTLPTFALSLVYFVGRLTSQFTAPFWASLPFNITIFALKYVEDLRERDETELHQPGLLSIKDFSNTVARGRKIESKHIRYTIFLFGPATGSPDATTVG